MRTPVVSTPMTVRMQRLVRLRSVRLAGLLATLVATLACDSRDFEEFEEISKLRVIGILADPPEIGPGETTTITPVVARPLDQTDPLVINWEVCAFTKGADSRFACAELDGQQLGIDLGVADTISLDYDQLALLGFDVTQLCEQLGQIELPAFLAAPSCRRGIEIVVRMSVERPDEEPAIAIRRVLLLKPEEAARPDTNHNPTLQGMTVADITLANDGVTIVDVPYPADHKLKFEAIIDLSDAETYEPADPDDETARLDEKREQLRLNWFTTHGDFKVSDTYFREGITTLDELPRNTLDLRERTRARVGDTIGIWGVLVDERGGQHAGHWRLRLVNP